MSSFYCSEVKTLIFLLTEAVGDVDRYFKIPQTIIFVMSWLNFVHVNGSLLSDQVKTVARVPVIVEIRLGRDVFSTSAPEKLCYSTESIM